MLTFGCGLLNTALNKLPIELHLPGGYRFCGPGTRLKERLARNERGLNPLDDACKEHDIAYAQYPNDLQQRHAADRILAAKAWDRVKHSPSFRERLAALSVAGVMKAKTKLGMGLKRQQRRRRHGTGLKRHRVTFREAVRKARAAAKPAKNVKTAIKLALAAARSAVPRGKTATLPRVIPIPKRGGLLPLIPIFAGLSALGALAGGAATVARSVSAAGEAKEQIKEQTRHNKAIEEAIALRTGKGLFLQPYKKGYGLVIKMPKNCHAGR